MGDIMKELDRAEDLLCKGIKEITDRDMLDASSLDNLKDAIEGVEKIYKTRHYNNMDKDDVNSQTYRDSGYSSRFPTSMYPYYINTDSNYLSNRPDYTRYRNDYNMYSRATDGDTDYNHSHNSMLEHLEQALKNATTEQEREAIRKIIADRFH